VGDEAVLTWNLADGLHNMNCIQFFYAYKAQLQKRKRHYRKNFGILPEFKAGLEMGTVTAAEVGEIKKEIAYHGDVLNTAARIQGRCNEFGKFLLISENLEQEIHKISQVPTELMGDIQLRGKKRSVKIYAVEEGVGIRN